MDHGSIYDRDIPSLSASLEAFDPEKSVHSVYSTRSGMQSSSRWSAQEAEESEAESEGPWAPPAWQKTNNNWYRKSLLSESAMRSSHSPSKSPGTSPYEYRSDRDLTPSRIPLPDSPLKGTPRTSPEPVAEHDMKGYVNDNIASRMQSPSEERQAGSGVDQHSEDLAVSHHEESSGNLDGCRFIELALRTLLTWSNVCSRSLCYSRRDALPDRTYRRINIGVRERCTNVYAITIQHHVHNSDYLVLLGLTAAMDI
jgi:hypothetical protein